MPKSTVSESDAGRPIGSSRLAVVVPNYRSVLTPSESFSLDSLETHLPDVETFSLHPEGLESSLEHPSIEFGAEWFASRDTYSRLLMSREFYAAFDAFDFILIYQLDCLLFDGRPERFTDVGADYFGAPWFEDPKNPSLSSTRVGNGGLSLRRISSSLRVLSTDRKPDSLSLLRYILAAGRLEASQGPVGLLKRIRTVRDVARGVLWYTRNYTLNEDRFWSDRAFLFDPGFRVASTLQALEFAWEQAPAACFEATHRLPFGCHAWEVWEPDFWQRHLERAVTAENATAQAR